MSRHYAPLVLREFNSFFVILGGSVGSDTNLSDHSASTSPVNSAAGSPLGIDQLAALSDQSQVFFSLFSNN